MGPRGRGLVLAVTLVVTVVGLAIPSAAQTEGVDLRPEQSNGEGDFGETITFNLTVENERPVQNNVTLNASDAPAGWSTDLSPRELVMDPLATAEVDFEVTLPPDDSHNTSWGFTVEAEDDLGGRDEVWVNAEVDPSAGSGTPDLVVTDVTWTPSDPEDGDQVAFTATVANQGDGDAGTSSTDFAVDGTSIGEVVASALGPGATTTVTLDGWSATEGNHTIDVAADANGTIAESDETNNDRSETVPVTPADAPDPDLLVTDVDWTPANPSPGETAALSATVENVGDENASSSTARFRIDGETIGDASVPSLGPGESATVAGPDWNATAGDHTVHAEADADDDVAEGDEGNNARSETLSVPPPSEPSPNLVVADLSWTPTDPRPGDDVTFRVVVENRGDAEANATTAKVAVDGDVVDRVGVEPLASGASATVETGPWNASDGDHTVRATADAGDDAVESDETDNGRTAALDIASHRSAARLSLDPAHVTARPGTNATATLTVANPDDEQVSYLLQATASDGGSATVEPANLTLAAGTSFQGAVTLHVPVSAPLGQATTVDIEAHPQSGGGRTSTIAWTVRVVSLAVDPPASVEEGQPGGTAYHAITLRNLDDDRHAYTVSASDAPEGWTVEIVPRDAVVPSGGTVGLVGAVRIPDDARAGTEAAIQVAIASQDRPADRVNATIRTRVGEVHDVALTLPDRSARAEPGTNATFVVRVVNQGNTPDNVTVRVRTNASGWDAGVVAAGTVPVAPHGSREVRIWVRVPANATAEANEAVIVTVRSQGDPSQSSTLTLVVAAQPSEPALDAVRSPLVLTGAATVGAMAALVAFVEPLKYRLFSFLAPLYSRLGSDEVLDHDTRSRIHTRIVESPGINYGKLKHALELNNGTLTHHLRMLERQELIQVRREGTKTRFFPAGEPQAVALSALSGHKRRIVELLRDRPGLTQKTIAEELDLSKQLVNYHVHALADEGVVRIERDGRKSLCYADGSSVTRSSAG